jgi:hypothetical protein
VMTGPMAVMMCMKLVLPSEQGGTHDHPTYSFLNEIDG